MSIHPLDMIQLHRQHSLYVHVYGNLTNQCQNYILELTYFLFSLDRISTHTIDSLHHQYNTLMSSALDHSSTCTSATNMHIKLQLQLANLLNRGKDIRRTFNYIYIVHIQIHRGQSISTKDTYIICVGHYYTQTNYASGEI